MLTGGPASTIPTVMAKGPIDATTRFLAGLFGKVGIRGEKGVDPNTDPRFVTLS